MEKLPISVDPGGVPYLANADSGGNLTVPVENYILSGGLYVPVSTTNPFPTSIVGSLANHQKDVAVTANTNILTSDYVSPNTQKSVLQVQTDTSGILSLVYEGVEGNLNSGIALNAGQLYAFEIILLDGLAYNLQFSINAIMQIHWVGGV